ncbi:hypothetical protein LTR56_008139 [Elasticomyces elasticus]|nr:hypothetical protein LTR56_008139 [Elasticomyces elasticus]KAK3662891.1 hypothetical protein LTR22_006294 [Elasticomyces elasticus]KAK4930086.1 hypothetical protein LTR49_003414 [Elasticomyces elasticus]KAK5763532.1 hypothetical protein LTS12_006303 [Elasticomyces elasticus]
MSNGKRLLDAAALLTTSSSIAKQHFNLRRQQWDVYTRTSSLAKAVKSQTDRVTVTAAAAAELARRFQETGPVWEQQQTRRDGGAARSAENVVTGLGRDKEDGTRSSLRKRELQRESEGQIPANTIADGQEPSSILNSDTFPQRPEHVSPEPGLSSLPRAKIPEHTSSPPNTQQSKDELNQDTFPPARGSPDPSEEGINTDIFNSPKVSKMLGRSGSSAQQKNPYANRKKMAPQPLPEMVAARRGWEEERRRQVESAPVIPDGVSVGKEGLGSSQAVAARESVETEHDGEIREMAKEIAEATAPPPAPAIDASHSPPTEKAYELRESRVPSSRFGRLWQYGGLAASMAFGGAAESFRRVTGTGSGDGSGSLMLSDANIERLVVKLSRMRGAALKLGQMVSFQDSKVLPPTINAVLQRVQDSADYMPASQRSQVLTANLGPQWRDLFSDFSEKPFAAASIGQVHKATLKSNGREVAVKIQYPGVRDSISSDLNNLSLLLTASRLLPRGMFLDRTIANARTELGWECDYEREAASCVRFRGLVEGDGAFAVPEIFAEASGPGVLTAEFMHGTGVTKLHDLPQEDRDWIGSQVLRLCLREVMEWRFMQTDPNWTNFLFTRGSRKLELLDFGASREFPDEFIEPYVSLLIAASHNDRAACRELSIELGYLTGAEGKEMTKAHVDSILTLAEPFADSAKSVYDFKDQTITDRVRGNIGVMLRERLVPPPEETYSLHRKLSGAFLLCARLGSRVRARGMFGDAVRVWEGRKKERTVEEVVDV